VIAYPFPEAGLHVDELTLRLTVAADVPALAPAFVDPAIGGEAGLPPLPEPEIVRFLERDAPALRDSGFLLPLTIVDADSTPLGGATLQRHDPLRGQVEIAYWLLPAGRGRGVATRVVRALARHAFSTGLARVVLTIRPENEASLGVAERAGFTREGLLRSALPHAGGRADAYLYALVEGE
jgi:RimJ/RimL family protein N-acetyltransferase